MRICSMNMKVEMWFGMVVLVSLRSTQNDFIVTELLSTIE